MEVPKLETEKTKVHGTGLTNWSPFIYSAILLISFRLLSGDSGKLHQCILNLQYYVLIWFQNTESKSKHLVSIKILVLIFFELECIIIINK